MTADRLLLRYLAGHDHDDGDDGWMAAQQSAQLAAAADKAKDPPLALRRLLAKTSRHQQIAVARRSAAQASLTPPRVLR